MKVRKKPVEVEATPYIPGAAIPQIPWLEKALREGVIRKDPLSDKLIIKTDTHGEEICNPGDWIMYGVEGEIYPCKDSVFQATYDIIGD